MKLTNNPFFVVSNSKALTNEQKAGVTQNNTNSLFPDDLSLNTNSLLYKPLASTSAAPNHSKSVNIFDSSESDQGEFSKINMEQFAKEKNHKPYKLNFLKPGTLMYPVGNLKKQIKKSVFDSDSNQDQQKSQTNTKIFQNNNANAFYEPTKNLIVNPTQTKSQLPQTASTIQEVKVQNKAEDNYLPEWQSSSSSCHSSSQKPQKSDHKKDLINLDEKPTSKVTYTMFQENQQISTKIQQKPISTVSVDQQIVVVKSQKVESQKVKGQVEGQKIKQKKVYDQVQSLRQRVKQLQQLNKQYLSIIENLSFTVKNMSLIPQQISNNNNSIEITEKKEKEQQNSTKKSEVYPKQQIFEQEEC